MFAFAKPPITKIETNEGPESNQIIHYCFITGVEDKKAKFRKSCSLESYGKIVLACGSLSVVRVTLCHVEVDVIGAHQRNLAGSMVVR